MKGNYSSFGCHLWARKGLFFEEKQRLFLSRGSKGSKILGLRNANVFLWKTKHFLPKDDNTRERGEYLP
jgi:hypothetical protein